MRVAIDPAVEDAPPPPYTAYQTDPAVTPEYTLPGSVAENSLPIRTSLRGGYTRTLEGQELDSPPHLAPEAYFEERRFRRDHASDDLSILEHNVHFDSGTTPTRLPFPRPSDAYLSRDVVGQDWATFVNHMFPIEQDRREAKTRSRNKGVLHNHSDLSERREKIQAVVAEWNAGFFAPRFIRIIAHFEHLANDQVTSSARAPASHYEDEKSRDFSQYQEQVHRGLPAPAYGLPPPSSPLANPSRAGLPNVDSPPKLRHSDSKASISSSSSSSSQSSVDSVASRDLDHATLPEIQAIIAAFREDPHKKNHIRKSVKELRTKLRSQHLPFSSSDPYNTKFSKDEKKKFKEQRKTLKKEIRAIIKETKDECKAEKKFRRVARRNRHDAREQERREFRQARRYEKHCHRAEKRSHRDQERGNDREVQQTVQDPHLQSLPNQAARFQRQPLSSPPFPGIPQARAAYARTTSWSSERATAVRTRSNDAADFARLKADRVRQHAADLAAATQESARQAGRHTSGKASQAGQYVSNTAANVAARAQDQAFNTSSRVIGKADRASEMARRPFDGERRAKMPTARQRADAAAAVLERGLSSEDLENGSREAQQSGVIASSGQAMRGEAAEMRTQITGPIPSASGLAELRAQTTGQNLDTRAMPELRTERTGRNPSASGISELRAQTTR